MYGKFASYAPGNGFCFRLKNITRKVNRFAQRENECRRQGKSDVKKETQMTRIKRMNEIVNCQLCIVNCALSIKIPIFV